MKLQQTHITLSEAFLNYDVYTIATEDKSVVINVKVKKENFDDDQSDRAAAIASVIIDKLGKIK